MSKGQIGQHNVIKIRSCKHYTKNILEEKLHAVDWSSVTQSTDVNSAWTSFKSLLLGVIDTVAPLKDIRLKVRTET